MKSELKFSFFILFIFPILFDALLTINSRIIRQDVECNTNLDFNEVVIFKIVLRNSQIGDNDIGCIIQLVCLLRDDILRLINTIYE